jgi:hypothetical protein
VVDAVDLPFSEMSLEDLIKLAGAFQIPAERFFDNQPDLLAAGQAGTGKPRCTESFYYRPIQQRRHGKVKDATALDTVRPVKLSQSRSNGFVKCLIIIIAGNVIQLIGKTAQKFLGNIAEQFLYDIAGISPELLIGKPAPAAPYEVKVLAEQIPPEKLKDAG